MAIIDNELFIADYYYYIHCIGLLQRQDTLPIEQRLNSEDKISLQKKMFVHFFKVIQECFTQIENHGKDADEFLSWLHWNKIRIETKLEELTDFQRIFSNDTSQENFPQASTIAAKLHQIFTTYLTFSSVESALINDYKHNLDTLRRILSSRNKRKVTVITTTASHFRNYINLLLKKQKVSNFPPNNLDITTLTEDANFIIAILGNYEQKSARELNAEWEFFLNYTMSYDDHCRALDQAVADAIQAKHSQLQGSMLERLILLLRESVQRIEEKLQQMITDASQLTRALLRPVFEPEESKKDFKYFWDNPKESLAKLWDWVYANPFKTALLVCGGVAIGSLIGGVLTGAMILIPPIAGMLVTGVPISIGLAIATATQAVTFPAAIAIGAAAGALASTAMVVIPATRLSGDISRIHEQIDSEKQNIIAENENKIRALTLIMEEEMNHFSETIQQTMSEPQKELGVEEMESAKLSQTQLLTEFEALQCELNEETAKLDAQLEEHRADSNTLASAIEVMRKRSSRSGSSPVPSGSPRSYGSFYSSSSYSSSPSSYTGENQARVETNIKRP